MVKNNKLIWGLLFSACFALPSTGYAKIYKCTLANGKVNFKDTPCTQGSSEEVSVSKTNVMDKNKQAERNSNNSPLKKPKNDLQKSPFQKDPLQSMNQSMCESAQKAYDQQVKEIKARCKKGRETFCSLPAEEIQKRWDNNYLKRERGDAFSQPSRQWHAFNNSGGAPIFNLKSQVDQYCGK